ALWHGRGARGPGGGPGRQGLVELAAGSSAVTRDRMAAVVTQLEVGRLTALRARASRQAGRPPGPEGSGAKLRGAATIKAMADLAVDLRGLGGLVGEDDWLTLFLTAPSISIRGGT